MKYKVPVQWTMSGVVEVEADSLNDAVAEAFDVDFPEGEYMEGSFTVEVGPTLAEIRKLKAGQKFKLFYPDGVEWTRVGNCLKLQDDDKVLALDNYMGCHSFYPNTKVYPI